MRDSMIFYRSFYEAIKGLPDEQFAACARAILAYGIDGETPEPGGIAEVVYNMAKPQIDKNNIRYENGTKGGRPKTKEEPNGNQTETKTKPNNNQTETKPEPNVNVNVNDYKRESTLKGTREKEPTKAEITRKLFINNSINYNFSARMNESLTDWIDYKIGRKQFYETDVGMKKLLNKVDKEISDHGEDAVIGVIDDSIANNYQGIIWDKLERTGKQTQQQKKTNQFNDFSQRNYDYDDLERQLLQKSYGG